MRNFVKGLGEKLAFKGNVKTLAIISLLSGAHISIFLAIWQPFVIGLGASVTFLGLLQSLGGARGIISSISKPIGGWASDRLGRKPFLVLEPALTIAALFIYLVAGVIGNYFLLIPGVILFGLTGLSWGAYGSIIAESVERGRRGTAYSVVNFFSFLPGIVLPAVGGYLAGRFGFTAVFPINIVLQSGYLIMALFLLRETLRRRAELTSLRSEFRGSFGKIFTPTSGLKSFHFVTAFNAFAWGLGAMILYGMLVKAYGFTTLQIGILAVIANISWVATQLPVGALIDKYGSKALMLAAQAIGIFTIAGWLVSTKFEAFAILAIFYGISGSAWFPARLTLFADSMSLTGRGEAMGRLFAFEGMGGFLAPFIGGALFDNFGFWAPISASLIGVSITLILIAFVIREPR